MADKVPVKATFDAAGDADGLSEFQASETVGYNHGGTGLSSLGTAGQVIKVNAGATALEWGTIAGDIEGVTAGDGLSGGGSSGTVTLNVDINGQSNVTANTSDEILIADASDSNNIKKVTVQSILDQGGFADIGLIIALG